MSNSWYLEVTNKNFSALTLPCGLSFFLIPHRSRDCTTMHWWVRFVPGSGPIRSLPFSWADTKEAIPATFTVCAHTEALCGITIMHFSSNAWYNPYLIKPCAYECSWACLGLLLCLLGGFYRWIFKRISFSSCSTEAHRVRNGRCKRLPFSPFLGKGDGKLPVWASYLTAALL